jgi:hypothetical protein
VERTDFCKSCSKKRPKFLNTAPTSIDSALQLLSNRT